MTVHPITDPTTEPRRDTLNLTLEALAVLVAAADAGLPDPIAVTISSDTAAVHVPGGAFDAWAKHIGEPVTSRYLSSGSYRYRDSVSATPLVTVFALSGRTR